MPMAVIALITGASSGFGMLNTVSRTNLCARISG
jgi:NADP-dependent 3-hydroxy acid dehydrogenase YdfG